MAINRIKADGLIRKNGRTDAFLRRGTTNRHVSAVVLDYKPREQELRSVGAQQALVSCLDPITKAVIVPPDPNDDVLVWNGSIYRIVAPDRGPRPAGDAVWHDLEVVYSERDA
jgi:hypothetical protein